jgi:hypothetical protein
LNITENKKPKLMKRILFVAALFVPLLWTACSGNKPAETTEDVIPPHMKAISLDDKELHLDSTGFPVKINVPDSMEDNIGMKHPTVVNAMATPNGMEVKIGAHFDILVNIGGVEEADLAKQKTLIEATNIGTSTFSTNDSTTLVWETKFGEAAGYSHFYHIVKIGTETYYVRDNNDNADNQFTKAQVDKMLESAKSLRPKPSPAPKS